MPSDKTKPRLVSKLELLVDPHMGILKPKKNDNHGPLLGTIFVWQEATRYAEARLKEAWKTAVAEGLIPEDDELRAAGAHEPRIIAESSTFSVTAEVNEPRKTFDRDRFIALLVKRYKAKLVDLHDMVEQSMVDGKAPLTKRVIEVE